MKFNQYSELRPIVYIGVPSSIGNIHDVSPAIEIKESRKIFLILFF